MAHQQRTRNLSIALSYLISPASQNPNCPGSVLTPVLFTLDFASYSFYHSLSHSLPVVQSLASSKNELDFL
ncbi:hypothetical protein ACTXT7_012936 [Hymenolepis weldensis]